MLKVSPYSVTGTGAVPAMGLGWVGLLCLPQGRCGRAGHYLGSVHQPPGVEQAEAVLVAVAEASLVRVPLGVAVLVLQGHTGGSAHLGAQQPEPPGMKGGRPRHMPRVGKQTDTALLERNRLIFV